MKGAKSELLSLILRSSAKQGVSKDEGRVHARVRATWFETRVRSWTSVSALKTQRIQYSRSSTASCGAVLSDFDFSTLVDDGLSRFRVGDRVELEGDEADGDDDGHQQGGCKITHLVVHGLSAFSNAQPVRGLRQTNRCFDGLVP